MLSHLARFAAPCAAIALSACARGGEAVQRDVIALRTEVAALRQQNETMARRLDAFSFRLDAAVERAARPAAPAPAAERAPEAAKPLVPPDLAVVRMAPARTARPAPALPTSVTVAEPDPDRLDSLAQADGREIGTEAEAELAAARRKGGVERAHALEAFVARYPRHPSADNALVEAARDYVEAGRRPAGCELARRVPEEYPAGDAVAGALEIAARCERSRP